MNDKIFKQGLKKCEPMSDNDDLGRLFYIVFLVIALTIAYLLSYYNYLSYAQSYMFLLGATGAYAVAYGMFDLKTDSVSKRQKIPITISLFLAIVLITSFLITSSIDSIISVIILITLDVSIILFFGINDWNYKRKRKQNPA